MRSCGNDASAHIVDADNDSAYVHDTIFFYRKTDTVDHSINMYDRLPKNTLKQVSTYMTQNWP